MDSRGLLLLLWRRFTLRHWALAPGQSVLLVLILALGIAVYFSVRLANRAAGASFQHFTDLVAAESDWVIQAEAGDLREAVLPELARRLGSEPVTLLPVVESTATPPPSGGPETIGDRVTYRVLGIDLVGVQNLARDAAEDAQAQGWFDREAVEAPEAEAGESLFWKTLRDPTSVFISSELARRDGLTAGGILELVLNERVVALRVAGVIPEVPGQPAAPATLLVMDLPALQFWTGRTGLLSRVEFRVAKGADAGLRRAALRDRLEAWSREPWESPVDRDRDAAFAGAERWRVSSPSERREAGEVMTRAFRLNLTILSLLALLVGWYLIVQAMDGAVVRRRAEIGMLRSLGVEASTLRRAWLLESAVIGLLGGLLGALLGWAGAQVSVRVVGRTVNALYYATSVETATLSAGEWWGAIGLALASSLAAGWWPARVAARVPPVQLMARFAAASPVAWAVKHPWPGAALLVVGGVFACLGPVRFEGGVRFPAGGYLAALCWIVGAGLLGSRCLSAAARALRPLGARSALWRLGVSALVEPTGRHALATAGLVCAVAMTAGMVLLVGSFDRTMRGWIARTFQADLYLSSAGAQSASTDNRISPETWRRLAAHPGVAEFNPLRACEIRLMGASTILAGGDLAFMRRHVDLAWVEPPTDQAAFFDRAAADPATQGRGSEAEPVPVLVLASESFAERFQLRREARLELPTPAGPRLVEIAGVFADYGNERGSLVVEGRQYAAWFGTDHIASLIVKLKDPAAAERVRSEWLGEYPGLQILTNAHLRAEILRIFRQTFAITYALEAIGVVVAVIGLGMTLASVLIERRGDWTTLRALGMRRDELARVAAIEGLVVAAVGLAVGLLVSGALGWLLIRVINKQTFGWTLQFAVPVGALALLAALVLLGAGTVSYALGRWGARLPADREE
ncbi:MAG: FtsX-like permease family protein [Verrucomicrobiales bacterium]|nr:FtsX-like permease family protein [Verrucomicrobiales bacterium]